MVRGANLFGKVCERSEYGRHGFGSEANVGRRARRRGTAFMVEASQLIRQEGTGTQI